MCGGQGLWVCGGRVVQAKTKAWCQAWMPSFAHIHSAMEQKEGWRGRVSLQELLTQEAYLQLALVGKAGTVIVKNRGGAGQQRLVKPKS